jgi:cytochrome c oxidase subunit 2
MPPAFPALKGSKIATGDVTKHIAIVLNGKPGTAMQPFGKILNDQDIADIIIYERNAWGNNTGDIIKPAQIKAARNQ